MLLRRSSRSATHLTALPQRTKPPGIRGSSWISARLRQPRCQVLCSVFHVLFDLDCPAWTCPDPTSATQSLYLSRILARADEAYFIIDTKAKTTQDKKTKRFFSFLSQSSHSLFSRSTSSPYFSRTFHQSSHFSTSSPPPPCTACSSPHTIFQVFHSASCGNRTTGSCTVYLSWH